MVAIRERSGYARQDPENALRPQNQAFSDHHLQGEPLRPGPSAPRQSPSPLLRARLTVRLICSIRPMVSFVDSGGPRLDVVAVGADIVGVQATSGSNVSKRIAKITESAALPILRQSGIRVLVHGWAERKGRWTLREVDLS